MARRKKAEAAASVATPEIDQIVSEQITPKLEGIETRLIYAILFRWTQMCGVRRRDPYHVHAQATRPETAIGRNFRANMRRCISQEMIDSDGSTREAVFVAINDAISHELPPRSDVEVGRARCEVLLRELEAASTPELLQPVE